MKNDKPIGFFTHGLHRINERGLKAEEARNIVKTGLRLAVRKKDHEGVVRPYEGNGWRIIVKETKEKIDIITAYPIHEEEGINRN